MSNELDPIAGSWYRHLDKGQKFVVVAVDEQAGVVEIQHFDGDLEQIELQTWPDMALELTEPPEDWSGPVDDVEQDDTDYVPAAMSSAARHEDLDEYPSADKEAWEDTWPEDERDDWAEGAPAEEVRSQGSLEDSKLASVDGGAFARDEEE